MAKKLRALISVYDKTGIEEFARELHKMGWQIYASGGTFKAITEAGVPATDVAELVGGSAILGHKVVTLSREIGASLLADLSSEEELKEMGSLGIPIIHLVCQDSYPLETEIAKPGSTPQSILQQSDIGGPNMLREAAKGGRIVLSVPEQRQQVLDWLKAGRPNEAQFVRQLANRAVYEVARYTMIEAKYWNATDVSGHIALKQANTKYGENPQQAEAAIYTDNRLGNDPLSFDNFKHVQGMEQSFVGNTDIDRLLQTSTHIAAGFERNFGKVPQIAVGVKHGNACGAAVSDNLAKAAKQMLEGDTRAIFGGVIMLNGPITKEVAEVLLHHAMDTDNARLLDGVIGSSVSDQALALLSRKKLRVIVNPALAALNEASLDSARRLRPVRGGFLEQPNYDFVQDFSAPEMQIFGKMSKAQKQDLILAWAVGSTSNSNTITLVKDGQLIGNGVGQQDRVGAAQLAISRTTLAESQLVHKGDKLNMIIPIEANKLEGASAYSDSFMPFEDCAELLTKVGIKAVLTSSGSVRDPNVIETFTKAGVNVAMMPDKLSRGFYSH